MNNETKIIESEYLLELNRIKDTINKTYFLTNLILWKRNKTVMYWPLS